MDVREKMHSGMLYNCNDETLTKEQTERLKKLYEYNSTLPDQPDKRASLLREMFAEIGDNCYVEPPLRCNWGGKHVHFGNSVYANFNLTLVDRYAHIRRRLHNVRPQRHGCYRRPSPSPS